MSPLIESCTGPGLSYTKCILCKWSVKAINLVHSAIIKNVLSLQRLPYLARPTQDKKNPIMSVNADSFPLGRKEFI